MACISLGTIDKNLIPILVACVFSFLSRLLLSYKNTILFSHPLISNYFAIAPKYFTIIPFIIITIRAKKYDQSFEQKDTIKKEKLLYQNTKKEISKGKWIFILLSGVIYFIQSTILLFTISIKTNLYILNILITSIFSQIVFKIKLFRHHWLSIILIILTGLLLDLVTQNLQNDIMNNWKSILLRFIREIVFSFHDIINKYAMENKFCSVYEISFYTSLILTVLFGIFAIFDYYFFNLDNYKDYFEDFNPKELFILLGNIITQLGLYMGNLFTNKYTTPCHIFIIRIFGQIALNLDFSVKSIPNFVCLIFILFVSLIFNEIIEFNFCGLSDNTKKNITLRSNNEDSDALIENKVTIDSNHDILIELQGDNDSEDDDNNGSVYN